MSDTPTPPPTERPIVYVREADPSILPEHLRNAEAKVFAVHDSEGNPLGIAPNRQMAFALATRNNLDPVSVH